MRTMYDSTTPEVIPTTATAVGGYPHGEFITWPFLLKHFRKANKLSFGLHPDHTDCGCLDCERGDTDPTDYPGIARYVRGRLNMKKSAKIYASRDNLPPIIEHLAHDFGLHHGEHYLILSAHYAEDRNGNHIPHICSPGGCGATFTADGTQWTDKALGRNLDESLLSDHFFPAAPKPRKVLRKPAKPHPKVTAAGIAGALATGLLAFLSTHGIHVTHLTTGESAAISAAAATLAGYLTPSK